MPIAEPLPYTRNSSEAVLSYLQRLLESADEPLVDILEGLAEAFAADGGGLLILAPDAEAGSRTMLSASSWPKSPALDFPWAQNASFLKQIKSGAGSWLATDDEGTCWLVTTVLHAAHPWLLWLARRWADAWTQADLALLDLAGKCLARQLGAHTEDTSNPGCPRRAQVQEGIDTAAAVTRRLTHDFCNILTSIQGFAELALLQLKPDSPAHRYAREVVESSRQGSAWTHHLQTFAHNMRQRSLPVSLVQLLNAEAARPHWQGDVKLTMDLEPRLPLVAVEGDALRKVLGALLDNAREAIAGPGTVSVSAQQTNLPARTCLELLGNALPGPHVEITITDTGTGLAADVQERLFRDMFFTTKGRRRGLGLSSVHGILRSYHAGFRLGSAPAQGAVVQVYAPVANPTANA